MKKWVLKDITASKMLVFHMADSGRIPSTIYDPLKHCQEWPLSAETEVSPWALFYVVQHQKGKKEKKEKTIYNLGRKKSYHKSAK